MAHFTFVERKMLKEFLESNRSYGEIGKILKKSKSSVWKEVQKGGGKEKYDPFSSEEKYRRGRIERKKRKKLEISHGLKKYIVEKIREDWSPEQIAGELKRLSGGKTVLSHETIYLFVYSDEGKGLKLWTHLRHKKRGERKHWGERRKRVLIPSRVSLHKRPDIINTREEFGHWEGDLMQFSNSRSTLAVFVERTTRKTKAIVNSDKSAEEMRFALYELLSSAGQRNVLSLTLDNGLENVCHERVREDYCYSFDTFFCDPYCSWQKGTVENTNKLLRQYFPRDIDPSLITQDYLDSVLEKLNSRPRKCLHFSTPSIAFKNRSF